ncbi:ABC transporter [Cellulomonas sp. Root485]|uniref:ATP-binding cassette domain-containing protein n=1 Tax=Cellulomonas sp. Root485 TaxID=1736546 RepID=UPI0006F2CF2D|nr:ATP-binding cassette domain-containing protein [Cellulomonas sp. Root485]KQY20639.1 ABC transporter [Cellulomonas sp. Root485]
MIHARGLARTYKTRRGDVDAVRGVDLDVEAGEIVGFLGPNGAGKTTTLRMLTTLLRPTRGEATVAGADLRRDPGAVRRRIGYVAQSGSTSGEARAGEEVVDHALLYGVERSVATSRGRTLFEQLELDGLWDRKCSSLSGGQRRRLDIVTGLIHTPRLVFLDEPTTGLDPQARANLWTHVRGLRDERGSTVFLTTHYLDEADALCDRILVIDHGQIVAQGSPEELKQRVSGDAVLLSAAQQSDVARIAAIAAQLPGADVPTVDGHLVEVRVPAGRTLLAGLLRSLDAEGIELAGVELRRPTLDDVFLTLTGRSLRDGESPARSSEGAAA